MTDAVRFQFTPDATDYVRVLRTYTVRSRAVWLSLAAMVAMSLVALWSLVFRRQAGSPFLWLIALFVPLLLAVSVFVWQPSRAGRQVLKQERLRSATTWQVDDSQVVISTPFSENKLDWGTFSKVLETEADFILIFRVNKRMMQFVPKRAFESPEQETAFRDLASRKLKAVKWL